jgi:glycogen debranching enzyme
VEYFKATPRGLSNQGWKDSQDAVFHADGRLAEGPIALAEVQGYVYAAKKLASWCADRLGNAERARQLDTEAAQLAKRFEDAFWCEEIGTYAIALDGDKQPCRVATSNAGRSALRAATAPDGSRASSWSRTSSPAGGCGRCRSVKPATIPCPTTMAPCGPMTMP